MAFTPPFNDDPAKGRGFIPPKPIPPTQRGAGGEAPIPLPPAPPSIGFPAAPRPPMMPPPPPPDPFAAKRQRDQMEGDRIRRERQMDRSQRQGGGTGAIPPNMPPTAPPIRPPLQRQREALMRGVM